MKREGFFLACLSGLLIPMSCTQLLDDNGVTGKGEVTLVLSAEGDLSLTCKSAPAEVPTDDFQVEIFKVEGQSEVRLYRDSYAAVKDTSIPLNAGDYRLLAYYGDPDAYGFDDPYYEAETSFSVRPQSSERISAVARLENVMVTVAFVDTLREDCEEYYAVVRSGDGAELEFTMDETRSGYMPAGMISVELYALTDGKWMYYAGPSAEYSPNDHVVFRLETDLN